MKESSVIWCVNTLFSKVNQVPLISFDHIFKYKYRTPYNRLSVKDNNSVYTNETLYICFSYT